MFSLICVCCRRNLRLHFQIYFFALFKHLFSAQNVPRPSNASRAWHLFVVLCRMRSVGRRCAGRAGQTAQGEQPVAVQHRGPDCAPGRRLVRGHGAAPQPGQGVPRRILQRLVSGEQTEIFCLITKIFVMSKICILAFCTLNYHFFKINIYNYLIFSFSFI